MLLCVCLFIIIISFLFHRVGKNLTTSAEQLKVSRKEKANDKACTTPLLLVHMGAVPQLQLLTVVKGKLEENKMQYKRAS